MQNILLDILIIGLLVILFGSIYRGRRQCGCASGCWGGSSS